MNNVFKMLTDDWKRHGRENNVDMCAKLLRSWNKIKQIKNSDNVNVNGGSDIWLGNAFIDRYIIGYPIKRSYL